MGCLNSGEKRSGQQLQPQHEQKPVGSTVSATTRPPLDLDAIMNMNKPANVGPPDCFPPAPAKPTLNPGHSEAEYKQYMRDKMKCESYENACTLYRIKEKNGDQAGMDAVVNRIKLELAS